MPASTTQSNPSVIEIETTVSPTLLSPSSHQTRTSLLNPKQNSSTPSSSTLSTTTEPQQHSLPPPAFVQTTTFRRDAPPPGNHSATTSWIGLLNPKFLTQQPPAHLIAAVAPPRQPPPHQVNQLQGAPPGLIDYLGSLQEPLLRVKQNRIQGG